MVGRSLSRYINALKLYIYALLYVFCSSNIAVEDSPYKITAEAAEEALQKAPELAPEAQSIESIGKYYD